MKLTRDQITDMWVNATIEQCTHENCYRRGVEDAERHHLANVTPVDLMVTMFGFLDVKDVMRMIIKMEAADEQAVSSELVIKLKAAFEQKYGEPLVLHHLHELTDVAKGMTHHEVYTMYEDFCSDELRAEVMTWAPRDPEPVRASLNMIGRVYGVDSLSGY